MDRRLSRILRCRDDEVLLTMQPHEHQPAPTTARTGKLPHAMPDVLVGLFLFSIDTWSNEVHEYAGQWQLLPELSFYETGRAPDRGVYTISVHEGSVAFIIEWTLDGENHSVSFGGPLDGELHPAPRPEGAMTAYTRVSSRILESTLVVDDAVVAVARRQVSEDGQLMAVLQQNLSPDGDEVRITQVYRRAH